MPFVYFLTYSLSYKDKRHLMSSGSLKFWLTNEKTVKYLILWLNNEQCYSQLEHVHQFVAAGWPLSCPTKSRTSPGSSSYVCGSHSVTDTETNTMFQTPRPSKWVATLNSYSWCYVASGPLLNVCGTVGIFLQCVHYLRRVHMQRHHAILGRQSL